LQHVGLLADVRIGVERPIWLVDFSARLLQFKKASAKAGTWQSNEQIWIGSTALQSLVSRRLTDRQFDAGGYVRTKNHTWELEAEVSAETWLDEGKSPPIALDLEIVLVFHADNIVWVQQLELKDIADFVLANGT